MPGTLYVVPTPIGNMEDMSDRAIKILQTVDLVLAEDTRTSGYLLKHFNIHTPMQSYHKFNEHESTNYFVSRIEKGENIALISDAGTPGISDPSYLLVKASIKNQIDVICLPGATAFVPALVVSGLPIHEFVFWGFLPVKKGRKKKLLEVIEEKKTSVLYESPHRILKLIEELCSVAPHRNVSLSREISKKFEETIRGSVETVLEKISEKKIKGEIVLVIEGKDHAKI